MTKFILGRFDDVQFFVGKDFNMEGSYAYAYWGDDDTDGPTFLFFADALKEEKF